MNRLFFLILSLGLTLPAVASNQQAGQILFAQQAAPATSVYRVCKQNCQYTTIQSAINQAGTDGFTSNDNPALVMIEPGTYTENLSLQPGVNLSADLAGNSPGSLNANGTGSQIIINGTVTYAVSNALNITQNSITLSALNFTTLNGITFTFSGTAPARVTISGCQLQKQTGGDSNPVVQMTNTGSGSTLRFQNNASIFQNVASVTAMDLQQGATEMRDRFTGVSIQSGVTIASAAKLTNAASLKVWSCDNWFTGAASSGVIDIENASAVFQGFHSLISNTAASSSIVNYGAAGVARLRWCQLQVTQSTSYLGKNTGGLGGTWQQGSNVIVGSTGTEANVQLGITINTDGSNATNAP